MPGSTRAAESTRSDQPVGVDPGAVAYHATVAYRAAPDRLPRRLLRLSPSTGGRPARQHEAEEGMRRIIGQRVVTMAAAEFAALRHRYAAVLLDVGTGDGKHVVHLARNRPHWLVVGLDANPDRMRRASARAAADPARGGLPNALFVWASVETMPTALTGVSEVHVIMPWGSLLRGMVGGEAAILDALARACLPGAQFLVALNLHAWRPPVPEVGDTPEPDPAWATGALARRYADVGWRLDHAGYVDDVAVDDLDTSWTKRLRSSRKHLDVLVLTGVVRPE